MSKLDKQLLALTSAARKQPDPIKRQRIIDKIRDIERKKRLTEYLAK